MSLTRLRAARINSSLRSIASGEVWGVMAARGVSIILGFGFGLGLSGALAADLPAPAPTPASFSPAPAEDWAGFYAGSFAGIEEGLFSTKGTASASGAAWGFSTGALVGYNLQNDAIVYGLEGDITSNNAIGKFNARPGLLANQVDNLYTLHARARLGYDLGRFLPFLAVGAAYGRSEQYHQAPLDFDGDTQNRLGWTIGAGVDVKVMLPLLGPSVLRAEYLYESFPSTNFDLNGPKLRTDIAGQTARFALISRIGEGWRPPADVEAADWAGDYAGAIGGGAWNQVSTSGFGTTTKFSTTGVIGGLYSGHNWMFGNGMLGFEGATLLGNVSGHGPQPGAAAATSAQDYAEGEVRGRAGYAFGRFMPYLATGVSYGLSREVDLTNGDQRGRVPFFDWTGGVGLDYMLSERMALRAEYLYARSLNSASTHLDSDACCSQTRTNDSLRVGIAYFFH